MKYDKKMQMNIFWRIKKNANEFVIYIWGWKIKEKRERILIKYFKLVK